MITQGAGSVVLETMFCVATEVEAQLTNRSNDIESTQRRAARFTKRYNVPTSGSVAHLFSKLQWPTLEQRRKEARLTMMYSGVTSRNFFSHFFKGDSF